MIEKEFVPYQESLELKELGFDEPCLKVGNPNGCIMWKWIEVDGDPPTVNINDIIEVSYDDKWIQIPTFNQVFRWFREKYFLFGYPFLNDYQNYGYRIVEMISDENKELVYDWGTKDTYEEAELACLRQLIKITLEK